MIESPYPRSATIKGIRWLTQPLLYPRSHGDVWSSTWADDGEIYSAADDTRGIGGNANSNLALYRIEGTPPAHRVELVNPMADYLPMCGRERQDTWKANGLACIDGILYLSVSQHSSAGDYPDCVQRVYDSSIVMSRDHGKTWSAKPAVGRAMFPGPRFATPFFVQFGQDYSGAMDGYVYAVSTGGTWNNGNYMILGRVKRDLIARLDAADWEFFRKADASGETWTPDIWRAGGIFRHRGFTGMTGIQYVPAVERFIMGQWSYENLDAERPWERTRLWLYEAPKPWGLWRLFHEEPNWGRASYNPGFPAKWFEDGGRRMWMTSAGDFTNQDMESRNFVYGLTVQKLELVF